MDADVCQPCDKKPRRGGSSLLFSRGPPTLSVRSELHAGNRESLRARLNKLGASGIVLLRGGEAAMRNDTDHEEIFRQESYFHYLFGVKEPGWWGVIELPSGETTLLMPRLPPHYATWMGKIHGPEHYQAVYNVDDVRCVGHGNAARLWLPAPAAPCPAARVRGYNPSLRYPDPPDCFSFLELPTTRHLSAPPCSYADEVKACVASHFATAGASDQRRIHIIAGTNSDSGANLSLTLPPKAALPDDETLPEIPYASAALDSGTLHHIGIVSPV